MKLKSVLCGMTFAGLAAGSAAVLAQTTPPDQPGMAPSAPAYVVPSAPAVVTTAPASGTVVTTPSSGMVVVPAYQSVPQAVVVTPDDGRYSEQGRYSDPSTGIHHAPDLP